MISPKIAPGIKAWATPRQAAMIDAVNEQGSIRKAAAALGLAGDGNISREIAKVMQKARVGGYGAGETLAPTAVRVGGKTRRFLLTAAQDETAVHAPFWRNLHAYADAIGAEVLVAGFTYQKGLFEDHATRSGYFVAAVQPYLRHENVMLGPVLFAAKMNILPTAVRPLSGLETYSRGAWAVFPHAKVQLVSVPSLPGRHPAMVMTTGACTVPNYIEKKAGLKAEFHHTIGATLAEIDAEGRPFCRQINAAPDGSFQDLDAVVADGQVTRDNPVEAITFGDLHIEKADPAVFRVAFGYDVGRQAIMRFDSMLHTLRPRFAAWHDVLDFQARNHHRRGDHAFGYEMISAGTDRVEGNLAGAGRFLKAMEGLPWLTSVVAASNHHDALTRWLNEADPREDPLNLRTWCELNAERYRRIDDGERGFDPFQWAVSRAVGDLDRTIFVPRNGSFVVCPNAGGGIEIGMHGDEGPNGARGSALALSRVATRMNIGHAHTASILDGVYTAGLCGSMDQGYNSGPSGWSHTQIVTYANSKRTLVTLQGGKWRA